MSPSSGGGRRLLHTRQVTCTGWLRDEGGFEVEGRMQDLTAGATRMAFKALEAGEAIHDMRILMVLDPDMVITELRATSAVTPAPECPDAAAAYAHLQGLKVGPGFTHAVKARVGGALGCTHLTELLGPMATTALQTLFARRRETETPSLPRSRVVDSCHTYRSGGIAIRTLDPRRWEPTK